MASKENISIGQRANASVVKAEPVDSQLTLSSPYRSQSPETKPTVKTEGGDGRDVLRDNALATHGRASNASSDAKNAPTMKDEDVDMKDASIMTEPPCYTVYSTVDDISYAPEEAMKQGLGMVKALDLNIKKLELGSKLRKDVWLREIESLKGQGSPTTMIAVCGATGAGKSSLLNAVMDDNIVPTSGMRACTAVVTEISYHAKKTIEADVSFLSETEWRQELTVLLDDLVDEDGNLKRSTDLRSDAGVAWQKVHAVYPTVTPETLVRMTIDQIITRDPRVAKILGTTKHIVAKDSKTFAQEIAKYIDSKDQKRGDKKGKDKPKEKADAKKKDQGKSLIEKMREKNQKNAGPSTSKKTKDEIDDLDGPAFWPLIRQVQVKCNAAALSTGAILVDLPGVADANAARNNIAKDYMKKCDCIWILAPITRAVDDKTARDLMGDAFKMQLMNGNYDANAITFIATKCDDISCSEVVHALRLEDDPQLEAIEAEIETCKEEHDEWTEKKEEAETSAREIDKSLKQLRPILQEYKDHLKALENGESFTPTLTAKASKNSDDDKPGKKRKRGGSDEKKSSKRRRTSDSDNEDDDDFIVDDDEELVFTDEEDGSEKGSDEEVEDDLQKSSNASDEEEEESAAEEEEVTEESLKANIKEAEDGIKEGRVALSEQRRLRKEAVDALAGIKKRQVAAQRQKNAFCSLRRSEFSRDVLKEDFRVGLKDLDDAAAEQRDPTAFDPTVNLRNYDEIDLPVFTCSARDYVRIKGQVKGDGDPTCFTRPDDTGIPELQKWCHHLTVSSRERAARTFLTHLKSFANSVKLYVAGIGDVTVADREALREKWESDMVQDDPDSDFASDSDEDNPLNVFDEGWASSDDPYDLPTLNNMINSGGLYTMRTKTNIKPPKVDARGDPVGITPRLVKDFMVVVDNCVNELQKLFRGGLEEKCRLGAVSAATAALETSDTFAASMHWGTYRATLRRHGSWRQDLNVELSNPFTRQIASSWSKLFESDLFGSFEKATNDVIRQLVQEVEDSAPLGLKERAKGQGEISFQDAKAALQKTLTAVRDTITNEQKEISRCLAPHVQTQLFSGYDLAMLERGTGSVARQKAVFHNYIEDIKDEMFDGAADVILERLAKAAEAVGKALEAALSDLAETIEVSMGVLWEGPRDDPAQVKARAEVVTVVTQLMQQVEFWQEAGQRRQIAIN